MTLHPTAILRVTTHAVITRDGTPEHPWQTRCDLCTDEQIHTDPNLGALAVNTRGIGNRDAYRATAAALLHYEKAHPDHRCDQCTLADTADALRWALLGLAAVVEGA